VLRSAPAITRTVAFADAYRLIGVSGLLSSAKYGKKTLHVVPGGQLRRGSVIWDLVGSGRPVIIGGLTTVKVVGDQTGVHLRKGTGGGRGGTVAKMRDAVTNPWPGMTNGERGAAWRSARQRDGGSS
jgi:hypothetical protein